MTVVRLILEHAPTPQAATEMVYHGGQMVVGRGDDADWYIDDPEKYISRKHFVVSTDADRVVITDASTGGLFIDGASTPLGVGNSITIEQGMRLRFGDFVAKVDVSAADTRDASEAQEEEPKRAKSPFDFNFAGDGTPAPEPTSRPTDLPTPFGRRDRTDTSHDPERRESEPRPLDLDNPFALDRPAPERQRAKPDRSHGNYFASFDESDDADARPAASPASEPSPQSPTSGMGLFFEPSQTPAPDTSPQSVPEAPIEPSDTALRKAFFKGLGIEPTNLDAPMQAEEMEALGRRFRALADGLAHMMKTRASEKQMVRVAQTIIGSSNVNPLKYVVGPDEAVEALVRHRGSNYLDPDASIAASQKDLVDHQVRKWTALQTALRKMIEKFDPEEIERELDDTGLLEALMAGGKSAKLWQLYQERYRDIAKAAEDRFLGEIGSDFRDAYEDRE